MTRAEIKAMLETIGLPYEYDHFEEAPALPFIVFNYSQSNNFAADNIVYKKRNSINIALYTQHKNFELEDEIEAVFDQYGVFYEKNEVYVESERAFQITYELEEIING